MPAPRKPEEIAQIMATYRSIGSARGTARALNIPYETVRDYVSGKKQVAKTEEVLTRTDEASKRLSDKFERVVDKALDYILSDNARIKNVKDAAVVAGIGAEKMALLRGNATQRIEKSPLAIILGIIAPRPEMIPAPEEKLPIIEGSVTEVAGIAKEILNS